MVVFLSDHDDMPWQHGNCCGIKNNAYRAAMHVPLIVRYPERFTAHETDAMVEVGVDMMPTLLDLCGINPPEEMHGQSYLPLLDGATNDARDENMYQVFTQIGGNPGEFAPHAHRGIRTKDWLYVRHKDERVLLYDERADYDEQTNLVSSAQHYRSNGRI